MLCILIVISHLFALLHAQSQLYLSKTRIATFSPILSDDRITPFSFTAPHYYVDVYEDSRPDDRPIIKQPHMGVQEPFGGKPSGTVEFIIKGDPLGKRNFILKSKHVGDFFFLDITFAYNADINRRKQASYVFEVEAIFTSTTNSNSNVVQLRNSTKIHFSVLDVNNNCPFFRDTQITFRVQENVSLTQTIGQITAKDVDNGFNSQIFYLLELSDKEPFHIDPYSGKIYATRSLILEKNKIHNIYPLVHPMLFTNAESYSFRVRAIHRGDSKIDCHNINSAQVTINVLPVNNSPPLITFTDSSRSVNNSLGRVKIHDQNEKTNFGLFILPVSMNSYLQLKPDDKELNSFTIIKRSVEHLTMAKSKVFLDLVAIDHFDLITRSVTARDVVIENMINLKTVHPLELELVKTNDVIYQVASSKFIEISEMAREFSLIGLLRGRQNIEITNYENLFSDFSQTFNGYINLTQSGALILTKRLDLESMDTDEIVIDFSLGNKHNIVISSFLTDKLVVKVNDFNEFPPEIKNNGTLYKVDENVPIGHVVLRVDAFDPDYSRTPLTFTLLNEAELPFKLDPVEGNSLIVKSPLNAETFPREIKVAIEVSDSGEPFPLSSITIFTIEIGDEDEYRPGFLYPSCRIELGVDRRGQLFGTDETFSELQLGSFSAQDIDRDGGSFIATVIKATSIARPCFKVDPITNALLVTCSSLAPPSNSVSVTLGHSNDPNDLLKLTIDLIDMDRSHLKLDCEKSSLLKKLESNNLIKNSAANKLDLINKNAVSSMNRMNQLIENLHSPKFQQESKVFLTIPENLPINTVIYTFVAIDNDLGEFSQNGLMIFSIKNMRISHVNGETEFLIENNQRISKNAKPFFSLQTPQEASVATYSSSIISQTGTVDLIVANELDCDLIDGVELLIEVCDLSLHNQKCDTMHLNINGLNLNDERPYLDSLGHAMVSTSPSYPLDGIFFVYENQTLNSLIGKVNASDKDKFASLRYTLVNHRDVFHIDQNSGKIFLTAQLDCEKVDHYDLNIIIIDAYVPDVSGVDERLLRLSRASQKNKQSTEVLVRVQVDDIDDNQIIIDPISDLVIPSDLPNGAYVTTITAHDEDVGMNAHIEFFLTNKEDNCFTCDHSTGVITVSNSCQGLKADVIYHLAINAFNRISNFEPSVANFRVKVLPVVINNYPPRFTQNPPIYLASIPENEPAGTIPTILDQEFFRGEGLLKIKAIDPDNVSNITYEIVAGSGLGRFEITNDGVIMSTRELDAEATFDVHGYWLTIIAKEVLPPSTIGHTIKSQNEEGSISFAEIFIKVYDLNDHLPFPDRPVYQVTITENIAAKSFITIPEILNNNRDPKSFTYNIISGNNLAWFQMNPENGLLQTTDAKIDREKLPVESSRRVHLVVRVEDREASTTSPQHQVTHYHVEITIADVNDNKPQFLGVDYKNLSCGISFYPNAETKCIGRVTAIDPDSGPNGTVTYSNFDSDHFMIDSKTGAICLKRRLDLDNDLGDHKLKIYATDMGSMKSEVIDVMLHLLASVNERSDLQFDNPQFEAINVDYARRFADLGNVVHTFSVVTPLASQSDVVCHFSDEFKGPFSILAQGVNVVETSKSYFFGIIIAGEIEKDEEKVHLTCTNGHSTSIHQEFVITFKEDIRLSTGKILKIDIDHNQIESEWSDGSVKSRISWKHHNAFLELEVPENFEIKNDFIYEVPLVIPSSRDDIKIKVLAYDCLHDPVNYGIPLEFGLNGDKLKISVKRILDFEQCPEFNFHVLIGLQTAIDTYPLANIDEIEFLTVNLKVTPRNEYAPVFSCYNTGNPSLYCYEFSIPLNARLGSFIGQIAASDFDNTRNTSNYLLTGILPVRYNISSSYDYFRVDAMTGEVYTNVTFSEVGRLETYSFNVLVSARDIDHPEHELTTNVFMRINLSPGPGSVQPFRVNGFTQSPLTVRLYENATVGSVILNLNDHLEKQDLLLERFHMVNSTRDIVSLNEVTSNLLLKRSIVDLSDVITFIELDDRSGFEIFDRKIIQIIIKIIPVKHEMPKFITSLLNGRMKHDMPIGSPVLKDGLKDNQILRILPQSQLYTNLHFDLVTEKDDVPFAVNQMNGVIFFKGNTSEAMLDFYEFYVSLSRNDSPNRIYYPNLILVNIHVDLPDLAKPKFSASARRTCSLSLPTHAGFVICQVEPFLLERGHGYDYSLEVAEETFANMLDIERTTGLISVKDAREINNMSLDKTLPRYSIIRVIAKNQQNNENAETSLTLHFTKSGEYTTKRLAISKKENLTMTLDQLSNHVARVEVYDYPEGSINRFYPLIKTDCFKLDRFKGILTKGDEIVKDRDTFELPFMVKNSLGFWTQSVFTIHDISSKGLAHTTEEMAPIFAYFCLDSGPGSEFCQEKIHISPNQTNMAYEVVEIFPRTWSSYLRIDTSDGTLKFTGHNETNVDFIGKVAYLTIKISKGTYLSKRTIFISWICAKNGPFFTHPMTAISPEKLERFFRLEANNFPAKPHNIIYNPLPSKAMANQLDLVSSYKDYLQSMKTYFLIPNYVPFSPRDSSSLRRNVVFDVGAKDGFISAHVDDSPLSKDHRDFETEENFIFLVEAIDLSNGKNAITFVYLSNLPIPRIQPLIVNESISINVLENMYYTEPIYKVISHGDRENVSYALDEESDYFSINTETGEVFLKASLDRETFASHDILVQIHGLISQLRNTFRIKVNVLEENDNPPYFDNCPQEVEISLDIESSYIVSIFRAKDADVNQSIVYNLISSSGNAQTYSSLFSLNKTSGVLSLDFERIPIFDTFPKTLSFAVIADDGIFSSQACDVKINLVNGPASTKMLNSLSMEHVEINNPQSGQNVLDLEDYFELLDVELLAISSYSNGTLCNCADRSGYRLAERRLLLSDNFDPTSCEKVRLILSSRSTFYQVILLFKNIKPNLVPRFINRNIVVTLYPHQFYLSNSQDPQTLPIQFRPINFNSDYHLLRLTEESDIFAIDEETCRLMLKTSVEPPSQESEGSVGFQLQVVICERLPSHQDKCFEGEALDILVLFASRDRFKDNRHPQIICNAQNLLRKIPPNAYTPIGSCRLIGLHTSEGQHKWTLITPDEKGLVEIDPITGQLLQKQSIDLNNTSYHRPFQVVVHFETLNEGDLHRLSHHAYEEIDISWENSNYFLPKFTRQNYTVVVRKSLAKHQILTRVTAIDLDYEMRDPLSLWTDDEHFKVQQDGWIRIVKMPKPVQSNNSYTFRVSCRDSFGHQAEASVRLEYPLGMKQHLSWPKGTTTHVISVEENNLYLKDQSVIYTLTIDIEQVFTPGSLRYYIHDSNFTNGEFSLDAVSGKLALVRELDAEAYRGKVVEVQVMARDNLLMTEAPFRLFINVLDANDNSPICKDDHVTLKLREDAQIGSHVYTMSAFDQDVMEENSKISYKLAGDHASFFRIDPSTGVIEILSKLPENVWKIPLLLKAFDIDNRACTTSVDIDVVDVNNHEPEFKVIDISPVKEDAPVGSIIGYVHALDVDKNDQHQLSYEIEKASESSFGIHKKTGIIRVARPLDRETQAEHILHIIVKDYHENQHTTSTSVTVTLLDVNDSPPQFADPNLSVSVPESLPIGSSIATVKATSLDEGVNAEITYRLITKQPEIHLDKTTGEITLVKELDYERNREYFLTIEAADGGEKPNRRSTVVTISVLDENDNSPVFNQVTSIKEIMPSLEQVNRHCYNFEVYEGKRAGSEVGQITASDADSQENARLNFEIIDPPPTWLMDDRVSYLTAEQARESFILDTTSGRITLDRELDRETVADYWFVVNATDAGKTTKKSNATCVHVQVKDVNDEAPHFDKESYEFVLEVDREGNITAVQNDDGEMNKVTSMSNKLLIGRLFVRDLDAEPNSGPFACSLVSQSHTNTQSNMNRYDYLSRTRQHQANGQASSFIVQSENMTDANFSEGYCSIYSINQLVVGTHSLTLRVNDNGLTSMNSKVNIKIRVVRQTNVPPELISTNATITFYKKRSLFRDKNQLSILSEPLAKVHVIDEQLYQNKLTFEIIPKTSNSELFTIDKRDGNIRLTNSTYQISSPLTLPMSSQDSFYLPNLDNLAMNNYEGVLNKLDSGTYPLLIRVSNGTLSSEEYIQIKVVSITDEMLENSIVMRVTNFIPNSFFVDKYDEVVKKSLAKAIGSDVDWNDHVYIMSVQSANILQTYPDDIFRSRRSADVDAIDILLAVYRPKNRDFMRSYQLQEVISKISTDLGTKLNAEVTPNVNVCSGHDCKRGECVVKVYLADSKNPEKDFNRIEVVKVNQLFPKYHLVPHCECPVNYGGPNCDQPTNECANAICPAPKVCVPIGKEGFTCVCPPPRYGPNCELSMLGKGDDHKGSCQTEDCFSEREFGSLRFQGNSYLAWKLLDSHEKTFDLSFRIRTKNLDATLLTFTWDTMRSLSFSLDATGRLSISPTFLNSTLPYKNNASWFTSQDVIADGHEHYIKFQLSAINNLDSNNLYAETLLKASQDNESDKVLNNYRSVNSLINYIWSYQLSIDSITMANRYVTWTPNDAKNMILFIGGLPHQSIRTIYRDYNENSPQLMKSVGLRTSFSGCIRDLLINGIKPPYQPQISPQQSIMLTMNTKRSSRILDNSPGNLFRPNRISLINLNNIEYGACDVKWLGACASANCLNGAQCSVSPNLSDARCLCRSGFYDSHCSKVSNPCLNNPCMNDGMCQKLENDNILNTSYICRCKEGFSGQNCEIPLITDSLMAKNLQVERLHENCDLLARMYNSPQGYCLNNGTCHSANNGAICICPEGWKGSRCEEDINECDIVYQQLKRSQSNFYSSRSYHDFSYDLCSWHGNSRGQCMNLEGSFSCNCSLGYTGRYCQIKNLASLNPDPNPFGLSQFQIYIIISLLAVLFIGALVTILIITFKLCPCLSDDERNRYGFSPNRWFKMKMNTFGMKREKQPFVDNIANGHGNGYHIGSIMHPSGSVMKLATCGSMTPSIAGSQIHLASYSQLPAGATPHTIGGHQSRYLFSPTLGTHGVMGAGGGKKRPPLLINQHMKSSRTSIMGTPSVNGYQVFMQESAMNRPNSTIDYRLDGDNKSDNASISSKYIMYNGGNYRPEPGAPLLLMQTSQNSQSNQQMHSPTGSSIGLHAPPPGSKIIYMANPAHSQNGMHPVESLHHIDGLSMGSGSDRISNQGSQSCAIRRSIIQPNGAYHPQMMYHGVSNQPTPMINANRQSIYAPNQSYVQYALATDSNGSTVAMPVIVNNPQMTNSRTNSNIYMSEAHRNPYHQQNREPENFDHDTIRPLHRGSNFYGSISGGMHQNRRYNQYRRPSSVALYLPPNLTRSDNQNGSQYSLSTDLPQDVQDVFEQKGPRQYQQSQQATNQNSHWDLRRSKRLSMNKRAYENPYSALNNEPLIMSEQNNFQADMSDAQSAYSMQMNSFNGINGHHVANGKVNGHNQSPSDINPNTEEEENLTSETPKAGKKECNEDKGLDYEGTLRAKV